MTELDRLDPRAVTLWRISYAVRGALFIAIALATELFLDVPLLAGVLAAFVAVITALITAFAPPMRHRAWGYRLRENDLLLRHGILTRTTSIIPHARIQHVDTRHGPIDRWLGLAEVVVFTAGTRGAVISIPGLDGTTAEGIRDRLAALSGAGDAV